MGQIYESAKPIGWSQVKFYASGDEYFFDLIQAMDQAQIEILVEVYIFEFDPLTEVLLQSLGRAQARGCRVRVIVDGFGSYFWLNRIELELRRIQVRYRIYHPLPRRWSWFFPLFSRRFLGFWETLKKLNQRNHKKLILVDQKLAFLGSLNWTQIHCEKYMGPRAWKDLGVRLSGGSLLDLLRSFDVSWTRAPAWRLPRWLKRRPRDRLYNPKLSSVRLNQTTAVRYWLYRDFLNRIRKSQKKIWIESAYFLPKRSLMKALIGASKRGVDIKIILPQQTDVRAVKWAAEILVEKLSRQGVKFYLYLPRVLHAKLLVIDTWATVGSHNLNHRSFLHDLELEAVFTEEPHISELEKIFGEDLSQSRPLESKDLTYKYSPWAWVNRILFRLRYLL